MTSPCSPTRALVKLPVAGVDSASRLLCRHAKWLAQVVSETDYVVSSYQSNGTTRHQGAPDPAGTARLV